MYTDLRNALFSHPAVGILLGTLPHAGPLIGDDIPLYSEQRFFLQCLILIKYGSLFLLCSLARGAFPSNIVSLVRTSYEYIAIATVWL